MLQTGHKLLHGCVRHDSIFLNGREVEIEMTFQVRRVSNRKTEEVGKPHAAIIDIGQKGLFGPTEEQQMCVQTAANMDILE